MLRHLSITGLLALSAIGLQAQTSFKAGWNTYNTGSIVHEYTYAFSYADTNRLNLTDSACVFIASDSGAVMTVTYPLRERAVYKTIHYFNQRKQLVKTEEYKDDNLTSSCEWKYDDKNRKAYSIQENKVSGNSYKKVYDYATDKKSGDFLVTESSYYNGRIEFYTRSYYNKAMVKYKEVCLNDNNKDVVHIESFTYGANGKVKERSVFFPEWKVTKKFEEPEGSGAPKCYKSHPNTGVAEKLAYADRTVFLRRVAMKNRSTLQDVECSDYEHKFCNGANCELVVTPTKVNKNMKLVLRYKEKPFRS
jgi:hypothetical protein